MRAMDSMGWDNWVDNQLRASEREHEKERQIIRHSHWESDNRLLLREASNSMKLGCEDLENYLIQAKKSNISTDGITVQMDNLDILVGKARAVETKFCKAGDFLQRMKDGCDKRHREKIQ